MNQSTNQPVIRFMEEIRRSPVEVGRLSHYLQGFSTIPGGCLGFLPSTVARNQRVFPLLKIPAGEGTVSPIALISVAR